MAVYGDPSPGVRLDFRHLYTPDPYGQNIMKPPAPCPNCGTCPTCGHGPVIYRQGWPWDRPGTTAPIWWVQPTVTCGPTATGTSITVSS